MEIILVRHAEAHSTAATNYDPNAELTELGKKQIQLVAEKLSGERFDRIYSSPLVRAMETATAIAQYHNDNKIEVCSLMREYRGTDNVIGISGTEFLKRFPKAVLLEDALKKEGGWTYYGGETKESTQQRAKEVLDYIIKNSKEDDRVLMTAHVGFNVAFISALLGLKAGDAEFSQQNTCVNRFTIKKGEVRIDCLNDHSHLASL